MTDAQFAVLRSLIRSVSAVGDAFGSEATAPGLAFPHAEPSLEAACRAFFPATWKIHPLGFAPFVARYGGARDDPAVHAFLELAGHFDADAAYLDPGTFRPDAHSRGSFLIVVSLDARKAAGVRLLVAFDRVET